ncbi:MAG: hypothetical protein AVO38_02590 [delta proteobacterium ML8_D]|jgi:predicted DsbA family dithiol-disulfide isomerase|nr:MAG: hypothetical protein AVO38_02590 [delta proteobacterium ML8_D]
MALPFYSIKPILRQLIFSFKSNFSIEKDPQKLQKSPKITHQGSNRIAKLKKSYRQKPVTL